MGLLEEKEWVNVANDLLRKCNINLYVNNLSECGAEVFTRLYESILGEQVPDFIAVPSCQENDAHNVQAVIDSLALDYLQVSLSHITGENIVKGDKESVRNLLEIFDGLLEYLTEEISETASQDHDVPKQTSKGEDQSALLEEQESGQDTPFSSSKHLLATGSSQSSDIFVPSWDIEGSESTSELIKLGDTAYLFSLRNEDLPAESRISKSAELEALVEFRESASIHFSDKRTVTETRGETKPSELPRGQLSPSAKKLGEPIRPAIPLQPPYQPAVSRLPCLSERDHESSVRISAPLTKPQKLATSDQGEPPAQESANSSGSTRSVSESTSAKDDEQTSETAVNRAADEPAREHDTDNAGKEGDNNDQYLPGPCFEKDKSLQFTTGQSTRPKQKNLLGKSQDETCFADSLEEPTFSHRRAKQKLLSDHELQEMSEKLSRRLNELDTMLKQALGERSKDELLADEDKLSQHSDSIMDYRQVEQESATQLPRRAPHKRRSLSISPPPSGRQLSFQLDGARWKDVRGPAEKMRDRLQKDQEQRQFRAKEQKYKESLHKESPRIPQAAKIYSRKNAPRNPKLSQFISRGGFAKPKKAAQMNIRENDLLPLMLEEFPHLHISRPIMNKMWHQQLAQIEQLKSPSNRNDLKLQSEVLETLKKHDLLVDLIKKEQAHNKRLQEFKQRIYRQKFCQNKMRERRQQIARAKKYYQDYRVQLRAKMMRARSREERIFKNLFEEGLEIQKQRLRELRSYAQDKRAEQRRQHQEELESMENYYKDQFSLLAEAVSAERREIQSREQAHAKTLNKVKRELRSKMEKEIKELQDLIVHNDDDSFFRELEADRLKARLLVASFQYSKNHPLV
uniref:Centrosomal protein 95 n=1 Tax=Salvator merianae TaxID=96440 RepID=A0A8D0BBA1_SALMN